MSRADGKKSRADGKTQKMYTGPAYVRTADLVILLYIYGENFRSLQTKNWFT